MQTKLKIPAVLVRLVPMLIAAKLQAAIYTFNVDALLNCSTGGSPLATITMNAGQAFTITANPSDLWTQGLGTRWSNANGLVGNLYATGSDDSGAPAGTLIGTDFGLSTQNGFTAPFGALVGKIGTSYFLAGTSYSGTAPTSGILYLMDWDDNPPDNSGQIAATLTLVPEPSSELLALLGFAFVVHRKIRRSA